MSFRGLFETVTVGLSEFLGVETLVCMKSAATWIAPEVQRVLLVTDQKYVSIVPKGGFMEFLTQCCRVPSLDIAIENLRQMNILRRVAPHLPANFKRISFTLPVRVLFVTSTKPTSTFFIYILP